MSTSIISRNRFLAVLSLIFATLFAIFGDGNLSAESPSPAPVAPKIVPSQEELQRPFGAADIEIFRSPPSVYRPETWFHFIGGNVSKTGITADLEAIAGAGISGVQLFHGQFGGPWPGVEPQIPCLSDDWDDAVKHVAEECKRLGLRFTMQNCPGWAMSGGPWIEPENAMRHLVFSRTDHKTGKDAAIKIDLAKPQPADEDWRDYREIAVIAFPSPLDESEKPLIPATIKSSRDDLPWDKCFAGNAEGRLRLPPSTAENPHWVEVTFPEPVNIRTVEFSSINGFLHQYCYVPGVNVQLEAMVWNGSTRKVFQLDFPQASWQDDRPISLACDEMESKQYRFTIVNRHEMNLNSIRLFTAARKNNWEFEAGWTLRSLVREGDNPKQSSECFVDFDKILDITEHFTSDGRLDWTVPFESDSGSWTILRFGHVNTGMRNGPAPPEGTGWECDKLSENGPNAHFAGYIGRLSGKDGPLDGGLLGGMLLDSWECKTQTWTPGLEEIFQDHTGYPLRKYLPAVFGFVVKDHETSKRFLRDWRGTLGDLFANKFYGRMAELAKENGLAIQYETAAGDIFPADILEYYKHADVPMCEFWQPLTDGFVGSLNFKPIKPTASAARIYGKPRVSAEAFTSFSLTWDEHWEMLKEVFNLNAVEGVTHCIFHTYTHNPRTDFKPPGTSMGSGIGTPFLRGQTWWKHVPEFTDYLSRCCFLLERGKPVSDVLWYLGDEIDHKPDQNYPFPKGYKYDYCNPDVLLNRLSVDNGDLVTPEGIRYRVLWLPDNKRMLPETLEKIAELVHNGATIVGLAPEGLATLAGGEESQKRFDTIVKDLWQGSRNPGALRFGKGHVLNEEHLDNAMIHLRNAKKIGVADVRVRSGEVEPLWLHRRLEGCDWYFIAAPQSKEFRGELEFRVDAERCEIWDSVTGKIEPLKYKIENGRPRVYLELPKGGSCFVFFRKDPHFLIEQIEQTEIYLRLPKEMREEFNSIGPKKYAPATGVKFAEQWTLEFPGGWGAPYSMKIDELKAWKDLDISAEGKAFSGSADYTTTFQLDEYDPGKRYRLDLGKVEFIAVVKLNGQKLGTLWAGPYHIDVTEFIKEGENKLEIEVTSTWFNRLVYDAGQPIPERKTWTISDPAREHNLRESGLLGPVVLQVEGNTR